MAHEYTPEEEGIPGSVSESNPLGTSIEDELVINAFYTHEERLNLYNELCLYSGRMLTTSRYLKNYDFWLSPMTLTKEAYSLLLEPLENMPLHINDSDVHMLSVAVWRLKCAR